MTLRPRAILAALGLAVPPFLLLGPCLMPGHALAAGDWTDLLYPFYTWVSTTWHATGRLPLWNDLLFSGIPQLTSLNSTALYPTELLGMALGLPAWRFYALDQVAHLWLAGCGMAWWQRRSGRSRGAAVLAGLSYMLGGHLLTLAGGGHPHTVRALAWLPFAFAGLEDVRAPGSVRRAGWAGATLGLAVLTNAIEFAAYAAPVFVVWVLVDDRQPWRTRWLRVAALAGAAAAVGAVVWLPGFEYYLQSTRATHDPGRAAEWTLSVFDLADWVAPGWWGNSVTYAGPHEFRSSSDVPGLVTLALATAGALWAWRGERRWIVLALVAGGLALGPATPAGRWLARLPVYGGFRTPMRWLSFVHGALAVLAAAGWDALARSRSRRTITASAPALVACVCAALWAGSGAVARRESTLPFVARRLASGGVEGAWLARTASSAAGQGAVRGVAATGAVLLAGTAAGPIAWLVQVVDLAAAAWPYLLQAPVSVMSADEPGHRLADLAAGAAAGTRFASDEYFGDLNARMALGLAGTWGYHGLPPAAYTRYWNWCLTAGSVEGMAVLNVGWLATGGVPPPTWRRVATATSRDGDPLVIAENPDPPLRAWLAPTVVPVPDVEAALAQVMAPGWNRSRVPVEGVAGPFPAGPRMGVIAPVWQRESLEADVIVPTASVMVLSEAWSPAWQAFLDGRRVRVLRAYGILRAVAVPAGRHRLVMRYESWLLKIGLWLTLAGMALLLADRVMDSA